MKIFVTGISGSGKSTVATALHDRGFNVIDVDHEPGLCSWINRETGQSSPLGSTKDIDNEFMDRHDYRCDINQLQELMDKKDNTVFVFAAVGDNNDFLPLFDKIILLQCSPSTMLNRLQTRDTNSFGKNPDMQERMLEWKKKFDGLMLQAGAEVINTDRPLDEVVEEVINCGK